MALPTVVKMVSNNNVSAENESFKDGSVENFSSTHEGMAVMIASVIPKKRSVFL